MPNKPQDPSHERKPSENASAIDYVRTKKEADAAADERRAEEERARATGGQSGETSSLHGRVKQHPHDDSDLIQNSSDEPVVEDEP